MNNLEEKLITEIKAMFCELIKEEDERFDMATKRITYPQKNVYVYKA